MENKQTDFKFNVHVLLKEGKKKWISNTIFSVFTLKIALSGWGFPVRYIWESDISLCTDHVILNNKYNCEG